MSIARRKVLNEPLPLPLFSCQAGPGSSQEEGDDGVESYGSHANLTMKSIGAEAL